jgi:hypothetical protein
MICVHNLEMSFGGVGARIARPQDTTILSECGIIIDSAIQEISEHYSYVSVNTYIIIPNHLHIIFMLSNDNGRAMRAPTS